MDTNEFREVVFSYAELATRLHKLEVFFEADGHLSLDPAEQTLLTDQRTHMRNLRDVAEQRIAYILSSYVT